MQSKLGAVEARKLIVFDVASLDNASTISKSIARTTSVNLSESKRRSQRVFKPALQASTGMSRSLYVEEEQDVKGLSERESCDSMTTFYSCTNGFVGCCSVDPCGPNNNCPGGQISSTTSVSRLSTASSTHHTTTKTTDRPASFTRDRASNVNSYFTTNSEKRPALISTASGSLTVALLSRTSTHYTSVAISVQSCPAGNGTVFTDTSGIAYIIHCKMDNSYSSDDAVQVSMGGYSECLPLRSHHQSYTVRWELQPANRAPSER